MFSHVMVGTNDIERSMRFYNAVLAVLGAGEPIRNMVFFGPQSGKMGVGLSVFSYRDSLTMGISADAAMVPDAHVFTRCFEEEIGEWLGG